MEEFDSILESFNFQIDQRNIEVELSAGMIRDLDYILTDNKGKQYVTREVGVKNVESFKQTTFYRESVILSSISKLSKFNNATPLIIINLDTRLAQYDIKGIERLFKNFVPDFEWLVVSSGGNICSSQHPETFNFKEKIPKDTWGRKAAISRLDFTDLDLVLWKSLFYSQPENEDLPVSRRSASSINKFKDIADVSYGKTRQFINEYVNKGIIKKENTFRSKHEFIFELAESYSIAINKLFGEWLFGSPKKFLNRLAGAPEPAKKSFVITGPGYLQLLGADIASKGAKQLPVEVYYFPEKADESLEDMMSEFGGSQQSEKEKSDVRVYEPKMTKAIKDFRAESADGLFVADPIQLYLDSSGRSGEVKKPDFGEIIFKYESAII